MRIQVVFNSTPILVPCGDGNLTVGELIQKAILRFKKVTEKVSDWLVSRYLAMCNTACRVVCLLCIEYYVAMLHEANTAHTESLTTVHDSSTYLVYAYITTAACRLLMN